MEIYELHPGELIRLSAALETAIAEDRTLKVTVDGGLKYKVGEGMWTAPQGEGI